jgi:hypothetical protein
MMILGRVIHWAYGYREEVANLCSNQQKNPRATSGSFTVASRRAAAAVFFVTLSVVFLG